MNKKLLHILIAAGAVLVLAAVVILLVVGSKLPNGEANFMWQDFLTREQFATVLYRFAQKFGLS